MTVTFKNAPLVELVAELRWGDTPTPAGPQGVPIVMQGVGPDLDQFLMRLGGEVYQSGFQRAERMVPLGFPVFPFQPIFRYRKDRADDSSVLFQAGQGLFSINAIPPYRSWETVSSVVRTGITALLKARALGDQKMPFTIANLRYINAFGSNLTQGQTIGDFVERVFGLSIQLPRAITDQVADGNKPKPHIQLSFPLKSGASMAILIGEGMINNEVSIILDMTVSSKYPVNPDVESIMSVFTDARNVIHSIFIDLTSSIRPLLEPIEEGKNV